MSILFMLPYKVPAYSSVIVIFCSKYCIAIEDKAVRRFEHFYKNLPGNELIFRIRRDFSEGVSAIGRIKQYSQG